jgi:hypothetical protein
MQLRSHAGGMVWVDITDLMLCAFVRLPKLHGGTAFGAVYTYPYQCYPSSLISKSLFQPHIFPRIGTLMHLNECKPIKTRLW